jgi:2,5-diamino-6-(ribosylamino)-4(3H)-pyrimidinone 5'-phosphate reductase
MAAPRLPFVSVNVAITADGKLAPDTRHFVPFSSQRDRDLMMELRSEADAVVSGATTVADGEVELGTGGQPYRRKRIQRGLREFNLRVILSGSASISPRAYIFRTRYAPILLLVTEAAPEERLRKLRKVADDIFVSKGRKLDVVAALEWLRAKWKVKRLLCEGGGEVNGALFEAGVVDEINVTICPVVFGGRHAPTLADGVGIERLTEALPLKLKRMEQVEQELYCVYRVVKESKGRTQSERANVALRGGTV